MESAQSFSLQPEAERVPRDPLNLRVSPALRPASQHCCLNNICAGVSYEQPACQLASQRAWFPLQPGFCSLDVRPGDMRSTVASPAQWHDSLSALMQEPHLVRTQAPHVEAISPCLTLQLASHPHLQPLAQWGSRGPNPAQEAALLQALLQGTPSHVPTGPASPPQQVQWWQATETPHSSSQWPVSVPATPVPLQDGEGIQRAAPWAAALLQQWDLRPFGGAADEQQAAWDGLAGDTTTAAAAASLQVQAALQQQGQQHAALLQQLQAAMSQQGAVVLRQQPSSLVWAAPAQPEGLQAFGQQQERLLLQVPSLRVPTPENAFRDQQQRLLKQIPSLTAPAFPTTPAGDQQPMSNSLTWAGHAWHLSGAAHQSYPQTQTQSLTECLSLPDSQKAAVAGLPRYGASVLQPGISYALAAEEAEQSAIALPEAAWHPGKLPGAWHDQ